ncbi:MAG: rhodanese-related sulfurtransferase [Flavobacteriales bacterium]|jgi:rhodanese-related sulfurtransferase
MIWNAHFTFIKLEVHTVSVACSVEIAPDAKLSGKYRRFAFNISLISRLSDERWAAFVYTRASIKLPKTVGLIVDWMAFINEQWLLISVLMVLAAALLFVEQKRSGSSVNHHEVTRLLNAGEGILLDLRDRKEFSAGHIVDSLNIPFAKLADRAVELAKHKALTIILVDKMGQQTGAAARQLKALGYSVTRMSGGMGEWQAQNLPVVKS